MTPEDRQQLRDMTYAVDGLNLPLWSDQVRSLLARVDELEAENAKLLVGANAARAELIEANAIMDYGDNADGQIMRALEALAAALDGDR